MRRHPGITLLIPALLLSAGPQQARAAGDAAYGEYLAGECTTCHGAADKERGIPPITGWDEEAFVAVLKSYKTKERANPAMQLVAASLDEEQMAALAAYYGAQPAADSDNKGDKR